MMRDPNPNTSANLRKIADEVTSAYLGSARQIGADEKVAWISRQPGVSAQVSGLPYASFNSVFIESADATPELAAGLKAKIEQSGLPLCIKMRPGAPQSVLDWATAEGFAEVEVLPLMALEPEAFKPMPDMGLPLRCLRADEPSSNVQLVADGLGGTVEAIGALMESRRRAPDKWKVYVGEVDGELAATGTAVRVGDHLSLMGIVTSPNHRRKGYAGAITSRMAEEGFTSGAKRVYLHASEMSYKLYQSLGFVYLESWSIWHRQN